MTPEAELVALIVDAAERRRRGDAVRDESETAARLVVQVGNRGPHAFGTLFELLAAALKERGLAMPSFDQLPDAVAPFALAFGSAIVLEPSGEVDMEATAEALDATMERTMGTSPRKLRAEQLTNEIRRRVANQVADGMRRDGLVPVRDAPVGDDSDDEPSSEP